MELNVEEGLPTTNYSEIIEIICELNLNEKKNKSSYFTTCTEV